MPADQESTAWFISNSPDENNIYVNVLTTPLTDRKTINLLIRLRSKVPEEEIKVITKVATLTQCMPGDLTEDDKRELMEQQLRLDEVYRVKAEGAYVRSWLEEGVQNTAYFF